MPASKPITGLSFGSEGYPALEAERILRSLHQSMEQAEGMIERLNLARREATREIDEAKNIAERTIAVAVELREDVSDLIVALQGLAGEVDAQVRDHTAALMSALSVESEAPDFSHPDLSTVLSDEVAALVEELKATAGEIAGGLDQKARELRELIAEASAVGRAGTLVQVAAPPQATARGELAPARPHTGQGKGNSVSLAGDDSLDLLLARSAGQVQDEVSLRPTVNNQDENRYAGAMELAKRGVGVDEIARQCNLGREEVRMLLRLHGQTNNF